MHLFSAKPPSHPGCRVTRSRAGLVAKWQWWDTLRRRVAPGWWDTLPRRVVPGWWDTLPRRVAPWWWDTLLWCVAPGCLSVALVLQDQSGSGSCGGQRSVCLAHRSARWAWGWHLLLKCLFCLSGGRESWFLAPYVKHSLPGFFKWRIGLTFFLLVSPEMLVFFLQLWRFLTCFTLWSLWKC